MIFLKEKLMFIISTIYFILILGFIIVTFYDNIFYFLYSLICLGGCIYFFKKKKLNINKKMIKYVSTIFFVLAIVIRIFISLSSFNYPVGDYYTFFKNANSFSLNQPLNANYLALFPHIIGYIILLGSFQKIFGTSLLTIVFLNYIFEIFALYFIFKISYSLIKDKTWAFFIMSVWYILPINIFWTTSSSPVSVFNSLLVICIYFTIKLINQDLVNKKIVLLIFLGLLFSFTNLFRPIIVILIIALLVIFIFQSIVTKDRELKDSCFIIIILLVFSVSNNLYNFNFQKIINKEINHKKPGFNLYVGSNIKSGGMWSPDISEEFSLKFQEFNYDVNKTQTFFTKKAFNNYINNKFKNIPFFVKKYYSLTSKISLYSLNTFKYNLNLEKFNIFVISFINSLTFNLILILNLILTVINLKNNKHSFYIMFLELFFIGFYAASLFLEVSPRYSLPMIVPLFILTIYKINLKWCNNNQM